MKQITFYQKTRAWRICFINTVELTRLFLIEVAV